MFHCHVRFPRGNVFYHTKKKTNVARPSNVRPQRHGESLQQIIHLADLHVPRSNLHHRKANPKKPQSHRSWFDGFFGLIFFTNNKKSLKNCKGEKKKTYVQLTILKVNTKILNIDANKLTQNISDFERIDLDQMNQGIKQAKDL